MKNHHKAATLTLLLALGLGSQVQAQEYPGMPANIAAELRDIGPLIEGQRTAALYAPYFSADDYANRKISRDVHYGPHERHVLDIFTNSAEGANKPVVIFVHGGGFRGGSKSAEGSPFYDNLMNWAVDEGMVGVNIHYRLAPEFQWPAGIEDLSSMVNWVKDNIANYGGDPQNIFLWGHSAGAAHVGDYLAWQVNHNQEDHVAGAILTSGFYVLGPDVSIWASYYGEDLAQYPERSSLPGLLRSTTPLLVNDAELDPDNFKVDTRLLEEEFTAANKPVTMVRLQGHSHLSETYAVGSEDKSLSGPVRAFIKRISNK